MRELSQEDIPIEAMECAWLLETTLPATNMEVLKAPFQEEGMLSTGVRALPR